MLQTNQPRPAAEQGAPLLGEGGVDEIINFAWGFLRRQYPIIVFCVLLTVAAGAIYLHTRMPKFTAHATMIIDMRKNQFLQEQSILADAPTDLAGVESQVQIVKSEGVAVSVIKDLHLTELKEFVGSDNDGLFDRLLGFLGASPRPPRSEFELMRQAISAFEQRLEASRVGTSYVLDISFTSGDPDRAAQIANAVADAYIVDQLMQSSKPTGERAVGCRIESPAYVIKPPRRKMLSLRSSKRIRLLPSAAS